jgi:PAS domain S-box-containing protein
VSLRIKTSLALVLAGLSAAVFLVGVWLPGAVKRAESLDDQQLARELSGLSAGLSVTPADNQWGPVRQRLAQALADHPHWTRIRLSNGPSAALTLPDNRGAGTPGRAGGSTVFRQPLQLAGGRRGELMVEGDLAERHAAFRAEHLRQAVWGLSGVALLLAIIAASLELVIHRPIARAARAAERLQKGDPEVRLPSFGGGEVGRLVEAATGLRDRLQSCEGRLRSEVSDREQILQALRESEQRYALAIRGANDGLWEWNLQTEEVYYSPRWKSMLGYGEDEVGSSPEEWRARVHPDDLPRVLADVQRHLSGACPRYENEHRLRHKDGSYRWVLARGTAIRNATGRPYRMLGLHTDVSDRKRAEEVLWLVAEATSPLSGEPFFYALVRNFARALQAHLAFVTECVDYPITRVRTLAYWTGSDFGSNMEFELAGTPCEDVIAGGKLCYWPSGILERYPKERPTGMDSYLGVPIFDSSGDKIIGHLAFMDRNPIPDTLLTTPIFRIFAARASLELERLRVERQLRCERSRLQAALEMIPDGIIATDIDGLVECINPAAERLTGWIEKEARGQLLDAVLRTCDIATRDPRPAGRPLRRSEAPDDPPLLLVARDGREKVIERSLSSVHDERGQVTGMLVVFRAAEKARLSAA